MGRVLHAVVGGLHMCSVRERETGVHFEDCAYELLSLGRGTVKTGPNLFLVTLI